MEGVEAARRQGDLARHDRLIAAAAEAADPGSVNGLGQMSMGAARDLLPDHIRSRMVISPEASVLLMRRGLGLG